MEKIYVLTWELIDKSGHGVVRVYDDPIRAESDKKMLNDLAMDKFFSVLAVDYCNG